MKNISFYGITLYGLAIVLLIATTFVYLDMLAADQKAVGQKGFLATIFLFGAGFAVYLLKVAFLVMQVPDDSVLDLILLALAMLPAGLVMLFAGRKAPAS